LKNKGVAGRAWSNWSIGGTFVYIYSAEADKALFDKKWRLIVDYKRSRMGRNKYVQYAYKIYDIMYVRDRLRTICSKTIYSYYNGEDKVYLESK